MKIWMLRASLAIPLFLASACGDEDPEPTRDSLAIVGRYDDNFDEDEDVDHEITETTWTNGSSVYHIKSFDNQERWIIAQNDDDNEWNAGKFSRFDWVEKGSKLYYCQSAYDADDEAAAKATDTSDPDDLEEGCGGAFAWTELFKK